MKKNDMIWKEKKKTVEARNIEIDGKKGVVKKEEEEMRWVWAGYFGALEARRKRSEGEGDR